MPMAPLVSQPRHFPFWMLCSANFHLLPNSKSGFGISQKSVPYRGQRLSMAR
jgi:hypothetical protein